MSPRLAPVRGGGLRRTALVSAALVAAVVASGCSGGLGAVEVSGPSPAPSGPVRSLCADLIGTVPKTVADDLAAREVTPSGALAAAWGDPPVVLRCGVAKPQALVATSACFEVNGVGWLATQDGREVSGNQPVEGTLRFTTIGRAAYVEVTVPPLDNHQPADPLPALAASIRQTIPERQPCQ